MNKPYVCGCASDDGRPERVRSYVVSIKLIPELRNSLTVFALLSANNNSNIPAFNRPMTKLQKTTFSLKQWHFVKIQIY